MSLRIPLFIFFLLFSFCIVTQQVQAVEDWVQVASGGLGYPDHTRVDAMSIYGQHIYIATNSGTSLERPKVFRAALRNDNIWEDVTPPWVDDDPVTDMLALGEDLFISRGLDGRAGELWRFNPADNWRDVTPAFSGNTLPIKALGSVRQRGGDSDALCLARTREGNASATPRIEVWCKVAAFRGPFWIRQLVIEEEVGSGRIGSARLHGIGGTLYLGFGGSVRTDRPCQVWKLMSVGSGLPIGTVPLIRVDGGECFGTGQGFVGSITSFGGRAYVGLAGGDAEILRAIRGGFEEVTPFPIRNITSFAVSRDQLYTGFLHHPTVIPTLEVGAGVIVTENGEEWEESNAPGFSVVGNRSTTAMAGKCSYLYAGVGNSSGFQVFRRNHRLETILICLSGDIREAFEEFAVLHQCVISLLCPVVFDPFSARLESIRVALESPKHPEDDQQLIFEGRTMIEQAFEEFDEGKTKILQSEKEPSPKLSRSLALEGLDHLLTSVQIANDAIIHIKTALARNGGQNDLIQ